MKVAALALLASATLSAAFVPAAPLAKTSTFGRTRGVVKATVDDLIGKFILLPTYLHTYIHT